MGNHKPSKPGQEGWHVGLYASRAFSGFPGFSGFARFAGFLKNRANFVNLGNLVNLANHEIDSNSLNFYTRIKIMFLHF